MKATPWALFGTLVSLATVTSSSSARAAKAVFSVAIGYNGVPASARTDVTPLRFADDDAAAFHTFARSLSRRSFLLTVLDAETIARFPGLVDEARPPSRAEVARVVEELGAELASANRRGEETVVLLLYSGHGTQESTGRAALTLVDGELDKTALYDDVLAPLRARFVHLFVDACHAETIVRPRDLQAKVVETSPENVTAYLDRSTLARFPNVGAIVASTAGAQAHEWDAYQAGIFTHELLSALRGAADVDGNGRVEYSEVAAFLASANRQVSDPRARPQSVIRAPQINPRVPIVDIAELRNSALLHGHAGDLGAIFAEDSRGNRIVDLRAEKGFRIAVAIPAEETLYLRSARGEASVRSRAGARLRIEDLRWTPPEVTARGALESSLQRGLFAARFGPNYYRGFADNATDLVAIELPEPELTASDVSHVPPRQKRLAPWITLGVSAALVVTSGAFGALAWRSHNEFQATDLERPALEAKHAYERNVVISISTLITSALSGGVAAYLFVRDAR